MNKKYIPGFFQKNALVLKGLLVGFLILLLMWPASHVRSLIYERQARHSEAISEVNSKWSGDQTITGPVLTIPYYITTIYKSSDGETHESKALHHQHFLPEKLNVNGEVIPEKRNRGIYNIAVYKSDLQVNGSFVIPENWAKDANADEILLDKAYVALGISDMRGIEKAVDLQWDEERHTSQPGVVNNEVLGSGVHYPLNLESEVVNTNFAIDLAIKGSKNLSFIPVGKETNVTLASTWKDPSFNGSFLPDSREVSDEGFSAHWNVLDLNRNFPQTWSDGTVKISKASFGVNLLIPADHYQMTQRSVKYALMFIALTFMVFFFIEVLNGINVHPFQYILIGLALVIFYTLILSFSEHIGFNPAYFISTAMTIGLIAFYARAILRSPKLSMMLEGVLVVLYGFIFVILQLQDYSLLVGSLGLFSILATVMYLSRKVDWYEVAQLRIKSKTELVEVAK